MSFLTKAFKTVAGEAENLATSKNIKKVASKASSAVENSQKTIFNEAKTLSEKSFKTTSAIGNQGVAKATAGGKEIAKDVARNYAKGAAKVSGIAGKATVLGGAAVLGVGLYNTAKNVAVETDNQRIYNQAKESGYLDFLQNNIPSSNSGIPSGNSAVGADTSDLFDYLYGSDSAEGAQTAQTPTGIYLFGAGLAGVVAWKLYENSKKKRKVKK
ncbi:hypothetical protein MSHOH_2536 [Methanosarcina horonobensis HB-1 = JCM 15518]|uniref:Uncharacterized protein n=1 Tax=Methanosarcina horonobensis HB-1 = JCM 15518 TaxID=1434110 RepID=A0A0E3SB54_9EURY|nr:hypothetical protein [Methanosarcina horonobensis]AKB79019.1 hypothetical protein MSHOH_2536 [Methanosarcina horonobensis HB-1 = JCM 15518]